MPAREQTSGTNTPFPSPRGHETSARPRLARPTPTDRLPF